MKKNVADVAQKMKGERMSPGFFLTSVLEQADVKMSQLRLAPLDSRGRKIVDRGAILLMKMRNCDTIIPGVAIGASTIICAPAYRVQEISAIHLPMKDAEVFHVC